MVKCGLYNLTSICLGEKLQEPGVRATKYDVTSDTTNGLMEGRPTRVRMRCCLSLADRTYSVSWPAQNQFLFVVCLGSVGNLTY